MLLLAFLAAGTIVLVCFLFTYFVLGLIVEFKYRRKSGRW